MVFADDIRKTILKLAEERGPDRTFVISDVAREIEGQKGQELLDQVIFVADVLILEGKIIKKKTAIDQYTELSKARLE